MSVRAVRVRITEKRPFLHFAEKWKMAKNPFFRYMNTPQIARPC